MASVAIPMVAKVMGILARRPPIFQRSCSSCMAWMTEPAPRKRRALKKAWVNTWNMPVEYAPIPTPTNM
ncbi:hypothetical protein D3C86_1352710 [compost metagenome]